MTKNCLIQETTLGFIGIAEEGGAVTDLFFGDAPLPDGWNAAETPVLREAWRQLAEYLDGTRFAFDLELRPQGSPFQLEVWAALRGIPYGETRSYKWLAEQVDRPGGTQAVGQANNRNPIAILIPCHRVIGADGTLTGYAGGLDRKRQLLDLEQAELQMTL